MSPKGGPRANCPDGSGGLSCEPEGRLPRANRPEARDLKGGRMGPKGRLKLECRMNREVVK